MVVEILDQRLAQDFFDFEELFISTATKKVNSID
jgi:hypothetical protein